MFEMIVLYLVTLGLLIASYGLMPMVTPDTLQFGVRVPPAHVNSGVIVRARQAYYRTWVLLTVGVVMVWVILAVVRFDLMMNAFTLLVFFAALLLSNYGNYFVIRRKLLTAKQAESWYEGVIEAVVADTRISQKIRPVSLVWALPDVVVTLVTFLIPAVRYQELPVHLAVHFNAFGIANGFAAKSFWTVFGSSVTQLVLLIVFVIVQFTLPRFGVRLNPADPDASAGRYMALTTQGVKAVWLMLAAINLATTLMLLPVWGIGVKRAATLGTVGTVLTFIGVIGCFLWIVRAAQVNRHVNETSRQAKVVARDDDSKWVAGAFYFNPSDPAIFVPKRFGIGATFNFGHPVAWVVLLLIIGVPVLIHTLNR